MLLRSKRATLLKLNKDDCVADYIKRNLSILGLIRSELVERKENIGPYVRTFVALFETGGPQTYYLQQKHNTDEHLNAIKPNHKLRAEAL